MLFFFNAAGASAESMRSQWPFWWEGMSASDAAAGDITDYVVTFRRRRR